MEAKHHRRVAASLWSRSLPPREGFCQFDRRKKKELEELRFELVASGWPFSRWAPICPSLTRAGARAIHRLTPRDANRLQ
jgi:hypothetical protein